MAKYKFKNREKEYLREYYAAHKAHALGQQFAYDMRRKFNLSVEEYEEQSARQGGVCVICGETNGDRRLAVDHNHATGANRGLLCTKCNAGLGNFKENLGSLRAAIAYLEIANG